MFKTPQVKHTHTAVSTAADKNIDTVGTESDIVDLLVVGNQLRFSCQGGYIPDGAGCVNARGDDETWGDCVPVEGSDRGRVLGGLRVGK